MKTMTQFTPKDQFTAFCFFMLCLISCHTLSAQSTFYVATDGNDTSGDGSSNAPWATITHALDSVTDGSLILVKPGEYSGRIRIRGTFPTGVTVRSETQYRARLTHNDRVITAYEDSRGCSGITMEGFEIFHSGPGSSALVVHIDGAGNGSVHTITLRNNILHDSYNNDLLKINNSCSNILVEGNMFYNQEGSDEHIDINSASDIIVQDNIFFNDFQGSGRPNNNDTSSFIVIKDSNQDEDMYLGSRNISVRRNVFFNWQGSTGNNFVLTGEDGHPFHEAFDVLVENNLLLGNSGNIMRSPFGVKGCRNITFRHNTVHGDLPSYAYGMRLNQEGSNPPNESISFIGNVWSDPTGTFGARDSGDSNDFSDTPLDETISFTLDQNLYWNGGEPLPFDALELINIDDDVNRVIGDPKLPGFAGLVLPRWDQGQGMFSDGSMTIRQAFESLVHQFGEPAAGSYAINSANPAYAPEDDILGNSRANGTDPDMGALESDPAPPSTPTPTPTQGPCTTTGVTVTMPSNLFRGGDVCNCHAIVCNAEGGTLVDHPLFVILDVYGAYFFAPSFNDEFDNFLGEHPIFPPGNTDIKVLQDFQWPTGAGSASGIGWYGALTNPEMTDLFGSLGSFEFGWE